MPIYDYESPTHTPKRPRRPRRWVFLCLLIGIGALFGLNGGSDSEEGISSSQETTQPIVEASDTLAVDLILPGTFASEPATRKISGRIRRGENFSESLVREGLSRPQIFDLVSALRRGVNRAEFNPNIVQYGDTYTLVIDSTGVIQNFEYIKRGDLERRFLAERDDDKLKAWKENIPLRREVVVVANHIGDSIWNALHSCGENPDFLTGKLEYIFEYYIDFMVDCRKGDRFSLAVEKFINPEGQFVRYGEILAAEYQSAKEGENYQAFLYVGPEGTEGYYDPEGKSLQGLFLKKPLNFTRISSKFSSRRYHPILKKYIPHHGIDYAAPYGTKVWAIADGVVSFSGYKGALGNYVEIKHKNGYKTGYGHLSKMASGLKMGQRVKQKQTIGYVGATGRATGPHLHFNFYATVNGHYRIANPDRTVNRPTGKPVPKSQIAHFTHHRDKFLALLDRDNGTLVTAVLSTLGATPNAEE